jgi:hypothetical protein
MAWLGFILQAAAAPNSSDIQAAVERFNTEAAFPVPIPAEEELELLLGGDVVKFIGSTDTAAPGRRATGMKLVELPMWQVWIGCQDMHFVQQKQTTEARLRVNPDGSAIWYGYIELPWPMSDRHWLVEVWDNHSLASRTGNQAWEHHWKLLEVWEEEVRTYIAGDGLPGISLEMLDQAIYTPRNEGAWFFMSIGSHTLYGYHAATVVGGDIPEALFTQVVYSGLDSLLKELEIRADTVVPSHYVHGHPVLAGGDGEDIPLAGQRKEE